MGRTKNTPCVVIWRTLVYNVKSSWLTSVSYKLKGLSWGQLQEDGGNVFLNHRCSVFYFISIVFEDAKP